MVDAEGVKKAVDVLIRRITWFGVLAVFGVVIDAGAHLVSSAIIIAERDQALRRLETLITERGLAIERLEVLIEDNQTLLKKVLDELKEN